MKQWQTLSFVFVVCSLLFLNIWFFQKFQADAFVPQRMQLSVGREKVNKGDVLWKEMTLWPSLVHSAHVQNYKIPNEQGRTEYEYLKDCWEDEDWFRMYADPYCVLLWLRILEHSNVYKLDNILPVVTNAERREGIKSKPSQNGGMRCFFEGAASNFDISGYWKPCRSQDMDENSENFAAEIIAFHIDHILGFHRTPAVVPKVFSHRQLSILAADAVNRKEDADEDAVSKIESAEKNCGRFEGQYIDGAMVGWANKEIQLLSKHRDKEEKDEHFIKFNSLEEDQMDVLMETRFALQKDANQEDITWVLENVSVNLFAMLTNNFARFGHNLFIQAQTMPKDGIEFGPFIFIDNDRSKWKKDITRKGKVPTNPAEHPLATFCKFPEGPASRMMLLYERKDPNVTLGKLVLQATGVYDLPSGALFTETFADVLDFNMNYIVEIINVCLESHPREEVLIAEDRKQNYKFLDNLVSSLMKL